MPEAKLFQPITIGDKTISNRIVIAPMCQYSATDGQMTDWHLIHLGGLAMSGAGILTIEATGVTPEGRITYADVGLYDDATEAAMARPRPNTFPAQFLNWKISFPSVIYIPFASVTVLLPRIFSSPTNVPFLEPRS